ncbi:hypothetical protein [uncultured Exiguobacterium sp.]|uniref:hypothetical protein n=1 Tax=uncultured Exiguobacterium sp. TaxID=202669 RepID=UPI0025DD68F8|nr:hypothetical protein [uncultured Exiguobacterium sp.]
MEEHNSRSVRKRKQSSFTRLKNKQKQKMDARLNRIGEKGPVKRPLYLYGGVILGLVVIYSITLLVSTELLSRGETFKTTNRYKSLAIEAPHATVQFVRSTDGNVQIKLVDSASSGKRLKIGTSANTVTVTGRDGLLSRLGNRPSEKTADYTIQVGLPSYMNRVDVDAGSLKGMGIYAKTIEMNGEAMSLDKVKGDEITLNATRAISIKEMDAVHAQVTGESVSLADYMAKLSLDVTTIDGATKLKPDKAAGTITIDTGGDIKASDRYTKQKNKDETIYELSKQEKPEVTVNSEVGQVTLE